MGTYLWSYAIDLDKLAAAKGGNDKALLRRALKVPDVEDNAQSFEDEIAEGCPRIDAAITAIVEGTVPKRTPYTFQYIYAAEALCSVLGKRVGDELKVGDWIEDVVDPLLKKVRAKDFTKLMRLDKPRMPIDIPASRDDLPYVTSIPLDEVNTLLGALARVEARAASEKLGPDAREALDFVLAEMRDRLRGATRRRCGLVTFMY